jgi:hypothetical protein
MYVWEPEEYATAWTMPAWPVNLAMGFVGKAMATWWRTIGWGG